MTDPKQLESFLANQNIVQFIAGHRLHSYRGRTKEDFSSHAQALVCWLRITYEDNLVKIGGQLHQIANDVEENELQDPYADGHHRVAAEEIRKRAEGLANDRCPWNDLLPMLSSNPVQRAFAVQLWRANTAEAENWEVSIDQILNKVWGDEDGPVANLRTQASRFSKFLKRCGIKLKIEVLAGNSPPKIQCSILGVNEEKVRIAAENWDEVQLDGPRQRAAKLRSLNYAAKRK